MTTTIGLISDTHGLLRPEAIDALRGVDHILHAGDVGRPEVLDALAQIAPTVTVRGNIDKGEWGASLPLTEWIEIEGVVFYLLHILEDLDVDVEAAGIDVVLYGHSHRASITRQQGALFLNPGSAGPRRFSLPVTLALITIEHGVVLDHRIVTLDL